MQINLDGRVALITGAASGIGRAAALALRAAGARIAACDRDLPGVESLELGPGHLALDMDVLSPDAVEAAVATTEATLGPIAIVVTAAGILQRPSPPGALKLAEWDRVLDVNLRGTYLAAAHAGQRMATRGTGSIITVSSVLGYSPGPVHAYGPAKAAVISLTQSLAAEWAPSGVRVNGVAPGFTQTPAIARAVTFGVLDTGKMAGANPMGRLISAEEVASVIVFLASDAASAINGVTIPVDGGFLASAGLRGFGGTS